MKAKVLMTGLVSLALLAVGCKSNKEAEPKEKGNAKVSVVVAGNASGMRAYGDEDGEKHIEKLTAIIYKGDVQEAIKVGEAGAPEVKDIECSAGERTLVVLANVPASMDLVGKTKKELEKLTYELAKDDETHNKLLMTSEFTSITLKAGKNYYGYANSVGNPADEHISVGAPLQIKRVHAAIAFEGVKVTFKPEYKDYNVKFDDGMVFALIAKKNSMIFGSSLYNAANQDYLYGVHVTSGSLTPANYTEAAWLKTAISQADIKDSDMKKGFYVLENASKEHPTILCLKGTLVQKNNDPLTPEQMAKAFAAGWIVSETDATTYYPVIINATSNNYSYNGGTERDKIVRNTKYNVVLTITGPGTNKPEDKTDEKANLDVLCKIVDWVIITQNATW